MKLYYAHYPALEDALVRFVKQQRSGVVDKWLVICASSLIARRLQTRLAHELGALANMHFITGGTLVGKLDSEAPGPTLPLLPQNHVRDFLIQEILSRPGLNRYPLSRGLVQAVKSALRDLADSLVPPEILEEHLRSMPDYVLEEDGGRFEWLARVYRAYSELENSLPGYRSYQNAFERALGQVENSAYLKSFSHILIYGFYDMPGRQLELLSRVRNLYPAVVFAPYEKHPAYRFAQKFFETNWLSGPGAQDVNTPATGALGSAAPFLFAGSGSVANSHVTITSVPNMQGAVFYTAKEILKALAAGQKPADIAVFVRTLEPYQDEIRRVFAQNCLTLDGSFTYPFTHYALGTFCLSLLNMARDGFSRETMLSIFSSPYFKQAHKNQWRRVVQKSAVRRDLAQWQDLLDPSNPTAAEVLAWLRPAAQILTALEQPQPWASGARAVWEFLQAQVDPTAFEGKDEEIFRAIQNTFAELNAYAALRTSCREGELVRLAIEALRSLTFNEGQPVPGGITLTDVVRARGLQFKTVFLLGLNDKEFPLLTPEDPLLRDYYRTQLRDTLGYWINASLDRGDEERLLFYAAATAATQTLHVCYARFGQDGKPAVPSVYTAELARVCELNLQAADAPRVSGRLSDRLSAYPVDFLTPKEVSYRCVLGPHPLQNYRQAGLLDSSKERSLAAAQALVRPGALGAYDGVIQSGPAVFARENARGFSPSALQEMGACPLKYFFNRALRLGEPEEPASRHVLAADQRGSAYHEVLHDFYQTLSQRGHFSLSEQEAAVQLERSLAKFYTPLSYKTFGIYPVVWGMILEHIRQKLTAFVQQDVKQLGSFTPAIFEQECTLNPSPALPLRLYGYIDRVDVNVAQKQFYVVDYKSTRKGSSDLAKDLFTQLTLQPFVYVLMAQSLPQLQGYRSAGSCLLSIATYNKRELSVSQFEEVYPKACAFLMQLAGLIQTGTFFISPSELCAYCPYGLLCRRDAFVPLMRARKSVASVRLEEARQ